MNVSQWYGPGNSQRLSIPIYLRLLNRRYCACTVHGQPRSRYTVTGSPIVSIDDTGFTAAGEFAGSVPHYTDKVFYKEKK